MSEEFNSLMVNYNANDLQIAELSEFLKDRLYFMVLTNHENSTVQYFKDWKKSIKDKNVFYLNVDDNLVYDGFYNDFGPLNLAMVYRFIDLIKDKLKVYKRVIHCTHKSVQKKRANAAFLICAYMIIEENWTAHLAFKILSQTYKHQYLPFRDASCLLHSEYSVTVEECVNALFKAKWYGFFDFNDFNLDEYEKYETVKYGDINWIVPGTLLAFSSPHSRDYTDKTGHQIHSPAYYYQYFKENNVKHVVRLNNKKMYDAKRTFVAIANIQHTDMIFTDGTPPSDSILTQFLCLCEQYVDDNSELEDTINESNKVITNNETNAAKIIGSVAVHCKAGLGRTGCLIASYIVKHWSFTAVEAIAWARICRPGSVIGMQQKWLVGKEEHLKTIGKQWRERRTSSVDMYKRFTYGVYSVKRNTYNANEYNYIHAPPQSSISIKDPSGNNNDGKIEYVQSNERNQSTQSSVIKTKFKKKIHILPKVSKVPNIQSDLHVSNLSLKRSASKKDDPKLKSSFSTVKSSRRSPNNTNNVVEKNITTPVLITKSNLKLSVVKKNATTIILNTRKTSARSIRKSIPSEISSKTTIESKPSYALATVASSARVSRRLHNRNYISK